MSQLQLFCPERSKLPRRPPDLAFIRKSLHRLLRIVREAEIMPWSEGEAESQLKVFPELAAFLPVEEAATLKMDFTREVARLRADR